MQSCISYENIGKEEEGLEGGGGGSRRGAGVAAAEMVGSLAYVDIKNCPPLWPVEYFRPGAVDAEPQFSS